MAYYLGIDLGTTYTAAAAEREGVVESLTLGNRTASVPSVVFLRDDGEILVGETATRRATSDPGRVAREFKRRVGDPTPIILGGTPYAAEMLMARLLRWSVDRVQEQQGEEPRAIALTHPANWGPYKLDLFTQAVRQVDLDAALLLAEPVAAATFYASQRSLDADSVVAVYDLGGGTFDAAVVRRNAQGFEMVGTPEGMERLGGIDFDEAVFAHVRNAVGDGLDRLDPEEPAAQAAVARLRQECIDAKEALSSDTDVSIPVLLPGLQTEVRLTRSEFEAMIRPAISETIVALRRAIRSASVDNDQISAVLLVGGSSRIPLVAQMVGAELGRPIAIDAHPKDAISFGAAIAVAEKRGAATPESVKTVLADSRPPPPTVSSDGTRRPAPPGASALAAGGLRPPAPGQRPGRPAPPGAPGGPRSGGPTPAGGTPARPAAPGSPGGPARPAAPGSPGGPARPAAAASGQPAGPGARPAAPGARPASPGARSAAPGPSATPAAPAAGAHRSGPTAPTRPGGTATPGAGGGAPSAGPGTGPGGASGQGSMPLSRPAGRSAPPSAGPAGRATPPSSSHASADTRRTSPPAGDPTAGRAGQPNTGGYRPFAAPQGGAPAGGTPYGGMPRAGGTPMGGHSSGSYPAMPARSGGAADNKVLWIVLGVVAAIALIVIIAVALSGGDESGGGSGGSGGGDDPTGGYTAANEQEFMDTCAPGGGEPMCACAWTEITETIPYDRFVEIENELAELGTDVSPEDLPSDLVTVMTACVGAS